MAEPKHFDEDFPNTLDGSADIHLTNDGSYPDLIGDTIFKSNSEAQCSICDRPTKWASLGFEASYCSRYCLDLEWKRFINDFNRLEGGWKQ